MASNSPKPLSGQSDNKEVSEPADFEARKLALAEKQLQADIEHRAAERELRKAEIEPKHLWNSTGGKATIGGFVTVLAALIALFSAIWTKHIEVKHAAETDASARGRS